MDIITLVRAFILEDRYRALFNSLSVENEEALGENLFPQQRHKSGGVAKCVNILSEFYKDKEAINRVAVSDSSKKLPSKYRMKLYP